MRDIKRKDKKTTSMNDNDSCCSSPGTNKHNNYHKFLSKCPTFEITKSAIFGMPTDSNDLSISRMGFSKLNLKITNKSITNLNIV